MSDNLDSQGRKWQVTFENPVDHGWTHERIKVALGELRFQWWCMADEVGLGTGTPHTHLFILLRSPTRMRRIVKVFPGNHVERCRGTIAENRAYITKTGKWEGDPKEDTSVAGTYEEGGEEPDEQERGQSDRQDNHKLLLRLVHDGLTAEEIVEQHPQFVYQLRKIDDLIQRIRYKRFRTENRDVRVTYVYGDSGTGKTRGIFEEHGAENICRVTDYSNDKALFDAYEGQDVLVFEEFGGQLPIKTMLNLLDVYPIQLPARYTARTACYTRVYITSNEPLAEQYESVQEKQPKTWNAFLRRIETVRHYLSDGTVKTEDPSVLMIQ